MPLPPVTVTYTGKDEAYCEWYRCDSCGFPGIHDSDGDFKYCPGCGREIRWK